MLTVGEQEACPSCRRRLIDLGDELVCPSCARTYTKEVQDTPRGREPSAAEYSGATLGAFLGHREPTNGERFSRGFSKSSSTYSYLKVISDNAGKATQAYSCARMIERACERLALPRAAVRNAVVLARKTLKSSACCTTTPTLPTVAAYSIITACRLTRVDLTWAKLLEELKMEGHGVRRRDIFKIMTRAAVNTPPPSLLDCGAALMKRLRNSPRLIEKLGSQQIEARRYFASLQPRFDQALKRVEEFLGGHNPRVITAMCLYGAERALAEQQGRRRLIMQQEIATIAGVSEFAVREVYVKLWSKIASEGGGS